jgi:hypothetical protein
MNASVDPLSHALGRIENALETITKTFEVTNLLVALLVPWSPPYIGALLFFSGLTLGLLMCSGGWRL